MEAKIVYKNQWCDRCDTLFQISRMATEPTEAMQYCKRCAVELALEFLALDD